MFKRLHLSYAQMALGLRLFVETDRIVEGVPSFTAVFGVTRSSYADRHYVLLGTTEPIAWYAVHPSNGAERIEGLCTGWFKPEAPAPQFVAELARNFRMDIATGRDAKQQCNVPQLV